VLSIGCASYMHLKPLEKKVRRQDRRTQDAPKQNKNVRPFEKCHAHEADGEGLSAADVKTFLLLRKNFADNVSVPRERTCDFIQERP